MPKPPVPATAEGMPKFTRRRLLGGVAAASLHVPLPAGAEGKTDVEIVQMLIEAHKVAQVAFDDSPPEMWEGWSDEAIALGSALDRAGDALCLYRPSTIEGVHRKAGYLMSCDTFVGGADRDSDFSQAELVSGFLPPGKDVEP